MNNIGQQVIVKQDQTRFVKSVYSQDEQSGYVLLNGKRVQVERIGFVDDRKLKQLWKIK